MAEVVSAKYGEITEMNGLWAVGEVSAEWHRGDNSYIVVSRGWPNSTIQISYINLPAQKYRETLICA